MVQNLKFVGELYCRRYVDAPDGWARENIEAHWWAALRFFFDHTFMQNRRVETSERLTKLTVDTLDSRLHPSRDSKAAYQSLLTAVRENRLDSLLPPETAQGVDGYKSDAQLNNKRDRRMVREVLTYIVGEPEPRNIYDAITSHLRAPGNHEQNLAETSRFLRTFHGVGDKIAPFVIQDVALLNRKTNVIPQSLPATAFRFAFPIDTLIRQVASSLGCHGADEMDDEGIKDYFIALALENGLYPPLCAAALWYLAANSTEVLIEHCIKVGTLG